MEKEKAENWTMKAKPSWKRKVAQIAEVVDLDASKLVRQAVNEKIERLAKRNKKVAEILDEQAA